jgi:hypothetical protein
VTEAIVAPAVQICAFALGCAAIHAARDHADFLTRLLTAGVVASTVLLLLAASLDLAPDAGAIYDEISVYAGS